MLALSSLLTHEHITIQCHDNPDADTIASAYGLYTYFKEHNKDVHIIYSGRAEITKSNLCILIDQLSIPITHTTKTSVSGLLITVDCQYGSGNVTMITGDSICIIDHHQSYPNTANYCEIASYLGSCSTLVWQMLLQEGIDFKDRLDLSTALYYGLFTDTNNLSEINHPHDKDMRDGLHYNQSLLRKLKNSNLNIEEIEIAGIALMSYKVNDQFRYATFKARPCDANILGFIVDLALQVDSLDMCVVYNDIGAGYKLSIRSCVKEVMASDMAAYITEGIGSGGGHMEKAGGFINKKQYNAAHPELCFDDYLMDRIKSYYNSYDVIYSDEHTLNTNTMEIHQKLALKLAYVPITDIFEAGTPVFIRTLECDMDLSSAENINIIIGIKGEVYPISTDKFAKSYTRSDDAIDSDFEYYPTIKNKLTDTSVNLKKYAKACYSTGSTSIFAKKLTRNTKVFTAWDPNKYMYGKPGDYIAIREDDYNDVYIIEHSIFNLTYSKV